MTNCELNSRRFNSSWRLPSFQGYSLDHSHNKFLQIQHLLEKQAQNEMDHSPDGFQKQLSLYECDVV